MGRDSLDGHKLHYEDMPAKKYKISKTQKGGKASKMTKEKQYNKTRGEHYKDIVITILVTAIVAFIAGVQYQSAQHEAVKSAVDAVAPSVKAEPAKKE